MSQIRETYSILNNGNIFGKYYGYTPIQAVSKAFSKFCKDKDYNQIINNKFNIYLLARKTCLLYTSPSPRDRTRSRMPSSA